MISSLIGRLTKSGIYAKRSTMALVITISTMSSLPTWADTLADVQKAGVINAVTEMATPPFDYLVNGEYQGYDKDLMDQVAEEIGVKVNYTNLPWTTLLPALEAKKFDIASLNVTATKSRAEHYAFTAPIAEASVVLLKRADDNSFDAPGAIAGKKVGAVKGGSSIEQFKNFVKTKNLNVSLLEYVNVQQSVVDLSSKRLDAAVTTLAIANYTVLQRPGLFNVVLPTFDKPAYFSWVLRKGDEDTSFKVAVNNALLKIQQDGRMAALQQKWFGASTALPTSLPPLDL